MTTIFEPIAVPTPLSYAMFRDTFYDGNILCKGRNLLRSSGYQSRLIPLLRLFTLG